MSPKFRCRLSQNGGNWAWKLAGGALYWYSKRLAAQPVIVKWEMSGWSAAMRYIVPAIVLVILIAWWGLFYRTRKSVSVDDGGRMAQLWELLFADESLSDLLSGKPAGIWPEFREALEASQQGRNQEAVSALQRALAVPNIESRTALVAWGTLRGLGVSPSSAEADVVRGVVYEIPLEMDAVVLAVYQDGRARLYSRRGKTLVWEATGVTDVTELLSRVLADGQALISVAEPGRKRTPIPRGVHRVTLLTFGGSRTFEHKASDRAAINLSVNEVISAFTAKEKGSGQGA
jgi:hypothetical protein